jgi:hypothetical protein
MYLTLAQSFLYRAFFGKPLLERYERFSTFALELRVGMKPNEKRSPTSFHLGMELKRKFPEVGLEKGFRKAVPLARQRRWKSLDGWNGWAGEHPGPLAAGGFPLQVLPGRWPESVSAGHQPGGEESSLARTLPVRIR